MSRQSLPKAGSRVTTQLLYRDRVVRQARSASSSADDRLACARDKLLKFSIATENAWPRVATEFLCRDMAWGLGRLRRTTTKRLWRAIECMTVHNSAYTFRTAVHATDLTQCIVSCTV